jgi:chromosomal replication initiation ATPase DnaA
MTQLPLPFAEVPRYHAEDFLNAPCNALARSWLDRTESWTNGRLVLWGEPACGKSFLLHLWAQKSGALIYQGNALPGLAPAPVTAIAVDEADAVAEPTALLHLLNAATEAGQPVLLTAVLPPARQNLTLPDLASRLRASLAVELSPPDDALLGALLFRLAAARQLRIDPPLADFLLRRLPRTPAALRAAVVRLDHAALASGGRLSRKLAAQTLGDLLSPDPADPLLPNRHSPELPVLL